MDFGKLPPQAKEIEGLVIGACLLDNTAVLKALNILHTNCFYVDANIRIWGAIASLNDKNQPVDSATVIEELKRQGNLDYAGGPYAITALASSVGSSESVEYHAYIVKQAYLARKVIEVCTIAIRDAYEDTNDIFDSIDRLQGELLSINSEINKTREVKFSDAVTDVVHELKQAAETHTYKTGNIIGLPSVDRVTMGWQDSDLIIVAGRPGMGKTSFAIWCAKQHAKNKVASGFISLEMSTKQLIHRIITSETDIDLGTLRKGGMKREEWERFDRATGRMLDYPIFIDDRGGLKINEVCNTITNWVVKHKVRTVYIDYIQLVNASGEKRNASREQDVSEVTRKLKATAKNLNISIVALSQLSRAVESRGDKRPMLSDLRESGAIEQDADLVIFPFCESYYDDQCDARLCEIIFAKYRNGKPGTSEVNFIKEFQRYEERGQYMPEGNFVKLEKDDTPF